MLLSLPDHLAARARPHPRSTAAGPAQGRYVVYWMRTAARADENPALDAALHLGQILGLPVFVYHALSERYPFASDRLHTFALEGARDVAAELAERGVGYAFHLEREGTRGAYLRQLAGDAAVVVTEDMPVAPLAGWTQRLAERTTAPVLLVDTACLVPTRSVDQAYERAFAYRKATAGTRRAALGQPWPETPHDGTPWLPELPFAPVDLAHEDLAALVAQCDIDHTVAPVPHTRGGSRAGLARWQEFVGRGLRSYAAQRNDPLRDGTSRTSAYLHWGHVSPFRLAREAAAAGGAGADKFLDELLVWRELAYTFCFHRDTDLDSVAALPAWARETLREHESEPRPALPSWEALARAQTGDPLWDAAQRSLLIHGELHNNVRMTWGKALLGWAPTAARALELALDLNHRYALDGRDPSSYGGILWCFGQFDRPFTPAKPILGTVRPRPTEQHARRLDVGRYAQRTGRPALPRPPRVAVVGAGLAGLTCARALRDHGLDVTVVDKARGTGGRAATRRTDAAAFDHGAQYFTAKSPWLERLLASWLHDGVVAEWTGRVVTLRDGTAHDDTDRRTRYVAVPGASALGRHLARDLDLRTRCHVTPFVADDGPVTLRFLDGEELAGFDHVVVATPAPQAAALLADAAPAVAARAGAVDFAPCLAVMAAFAEPLPIDFDAARVEGSPLAWAARNSSKPGRPDGEAWVLHAAPAWSAEHFDDDPEAVREHLLAAWSEATGKALPKPSLTASHRWRFAQATSPLEQSYLLDDAIPRFSLCGDWCLGARVENALQSGAALAGRLLGRWAQAPESMS